MHITANGWTFFVVIAVIYLVTRERHMWSEDTTGLIAVIVSMLGLAAIITVACLIIAVAPWLLVILAICGLCAIKDNI